MVDVDQLPVPDWGLRCPECDQPLAGARAFRCGQCGRPFNVRFLLGQARPVPDLGLACSRCGYLLIGLMGERCPECGTEFSVREMLEEGSPLGATTGSGEDDPPDHHIATRAPRFTGHERPLPDFGLCCAACESPLTGATADSCPACGAAFDLAAVVPPGDWVNMRGFISRSMGPVARALFADAGIPYLVDNRALQHLYGSTMSFVSGTVRVPRAFFWDALHVLGEAETSVAAAPGQPWVCPACEEQVPGDFEVCWNCNAARDEPDE